MIRLAESDDLALLPAIERAAGQRFHSIGMADVANDNGSGVEDFRAANEAGRLWVAEYDERVCGFLVASIIDGDGHIDEVSVHPDAAGRRLGSELITMFLAWCAACEFEAATLTTFANVPWNRPYYERLGFLVVPPEAWSSAMTSQVEQETRAGLDPSLRVVMRYPL